MKKHIIAIGGRPGSGKSTIKHMVAEKLNYKTFSTGDFTRNLATERGMTLEAFNDLVAKNKELDELIDAELTRIETEEDTMVIDSHLAFHFIPSSFKVFLKISPEESARRIFEDRQSEIRQKSGDVMETLEEAMERTEKRVQNHNDRYMRHYGISPYDEKNFDIVIDTTEKQLEAIVDQIVSQFQTWLST